MKSKPCNRCYYGIVGAWLENARGTNIPLSYTCSLGEYSRLHCSYLPTKFVNETSHLNCDIIRASKVC